MGQARVDPADIMGVVPTGLPEHRIQAVLVFRVHGIEGLFG